jgi:hypothetical protein
VVHGVEPEGMELLHLRGPNGCSRPAGGVGSSGVLRVYDISRQLTLLMFFSAFRAI